MRNVPKVLMLELAEAALDQPNPTEDLKRTLNAVLKVGYHPDRERVK